MPVYSQISTRALNARERDILQPPRLSPWLGALFEALLVFVLASGAVAVAYGVMAGIGTNVLSRFRRATEAGMSADQAGEVSGLADTLGDNVDVAIALLCVVLPLVLAGYNYARGVDRRRRARAEVEDTVVQVIEVRDGRCAAFDHVQADGIAEHMYLVELQDGCSLLLADVWLPDDPVWHCDDAEDEPQAMIAREHAEATGEWSGWRPNFPNSHFVLESMEINGIADELVLHGRPVMPLRVKAPGALLHAHAEALLQTRRSARVVEEPFDALLRPDLG